MIEEEGVVIVSEGKKNQVKRKKKEVRVGF